ncbi:MAG: hypothetical protein Q9176_005963 [Flavoplaca citrina]
MKGLKSYTTRSIDDPPFDMFHTIHNHKNSLEYLCIGAEEDVVRDYQESTQDSLSDRQEYIDALAEDFESSVTAFPPLSLGTLHLIGFDFSKIIGPSISILELQSLSTLTLETCPGLERAFDILAREKNQSDSPLRSRLQLRSFSIRHEGSNPQFRIRLLGFLCAIRGLTHLSILLEDHTRRAFALFKQLRTLNVRNMPLVDPKNMALPLSEIHAGFANSLVKILLCKKDALSSSAPQNLKTLALGALTYRDIRNGIGYHTIHNRELYDFLRLKVFRVIRNYQVDDGRPRPAAVLTESGTYEKTEANGGAVNVLKPYWLG